ncbi:flagellar biosynthesis protein FliQ [Ampullimonas aquatilis]|uniref:flagellar biosynthesis protein FliQ n=1 Tax=Ampullimonas aquatilis TaxID=1341549 RepID=UPI003C711BA8
MFTTQTVMTVGQEALRMTLLLAAPLLIAALAVGLIISIFQAATQINEATLSFIPKVIAVFLVLLLVGPWMLQTMLDYMRNVLTSFPHMIG